MTRQSVLVTVLEDPRMDIERHVHVDVRVSIPPAQEVDGQEVLGMTTWMAKSLKPREDLELLMLQCALALAVKDGVRW
jgi:pyruvate-formate lyase-activating enzyme